MLPQVVVDVNDAVLSDDGGENLFSMLLGNKLPPSHKTATLRKTWREGSGWR